MAGLVNQYQQGTLTTPVEGGSLDASVVTSNDNAVGAKHNSHDADATIHVQSSALSARPSAGTAQRFWVTTDGRRAYLDSGSVWGELAYLTSGAAATLTTTTTPQLTVAYDGSNKFTITVASTGATTFDATGAGAAFIIADGQLVTGIGAGTARSDTGIEVQHAGDTGMSFFNTETPGSTTHETFVYFGGRDSGGSIKKTSSISSVWIDTDATTGYAALRLNATRTGGAADDVFLKGYGGAGARFFSDSATGPGASILAINGDITVSATVKAAATISVGNATPSASGAGISFPATQSASSDANTLDDYEEGTWTPSDGSGAALSFTSVAATYEKIGRLVIARCTLTYPATANGSNSQIDGLPFTLGSGSDNRQGFVGVSTETTLRYVYPAAATTAVQPHDSSGARITNATLSGDLINMTIIYRI